MVTWCARDCPKKKKIIFEIICAYYIIIFRQLQITKIEMEDSTCTIPKL